VSRCEAPIARTPGAPTRFSAALAAPTLVLTVGFGIGGALVLPGDA
jgi:hypothetical protein